MIFEVLGAALLGFGIAYGALARYSGRFHDRRLVLITGPVAAVLGAGLAHTILGPGQAAPTLAIAVGFAAAMLSLLVNRGARVAARPARYYSYPSAPSYSTYSRADRARPTRP